MDPNIGTVDFIVDFEMKDLIFEFLEPAPVVPQDGWVRKASECSSELDNDEIVDKRSQSAQPNLKPVELQHEREDVVDPTAGAIVLLVRGEAVLAACLLYILGVWCGGSMSRPEITRDQTALQDMSRGPIAMSMPVGEKKRRIVPNRHQNAGDKER
jgi:hypothetical protein